MRRRTIATVAFTLVALAIGGLAFAMSGLVSVAASSGHWSATYWLLHTALRRAVTTQSAMIEVPPLDDPALARRGAGHYEAGCSPCHGAPGKARAAIAETMVPPPPELHYKVRDWEAEELFWIVRHGIKFTGMPAWPAPFRDDEVWAVVAFLTALPDLDAEGYASLAGLDTGGPRAGERSEMPLAVSAGCARCHGVDGAGRGDGAFPRLDGQKEAYLLESLRAFAAEDRHSGIMETAVAGLDDAALRALAAHYAAQKAPPPIAGEIDAEALRRGEELAQEGNPRRGVPACLTCHGEGAAAANPVFPRLEGQPADYLATQLRLFRAGQRGGTPFAHIMASVAWRLTDRQITDVATYFSSRPENREDPAM